MAELLDFSKSKIIPDERTQNWPLMNPYHMLAVGVAYLTIILIGKAVMNKREGFDLWVFRVLHNALLTTVSLYLTVEILRQVIMSSLYRSNTVLVKKLAGCCYKLLWSNFP